MSFDGITTKSIVNELNTVLIGGKVNKIYQPSKNDIVLDIYSNKTKFLLNICVDSKNYRINISNFEKINPLTAPNFCMLLRKHLTGSKILEISNYDLERVVNIYFETYNELNDKIIKKLVIELMGSNSNIILLNEKNIIIDSLKHFDSTRDIMPARHYIYPINTKNSFLEITSFEDFIKIYNSNISTDPVDKKFSDMFSGISRPLIQHIIDKLKINDFDNSNLEKIFLYLKTILGSIIKNEVCLINYNTDYIIDLRQRKYQLFY